MEKPSYNTLTALILASLASGSALAQTEDTMVVTASGFQQRIQDSPATISVIPANSWKPAPTATSPMR